MFKLNELEFLCFYINVMVLIKNKFEKKYKKI